MSFCAKYFAAQDKLRNLLALDVQYHSKTPTTTTRFLHTPDWTRLVQWSLAVGHAVGLHPLGTDVAITNMSRSADACGSLPTGIADMLLFAATHLWTASKVVGNATLTIEQTLSMLARDGVAVDAETLKASERKELNTLKWKVAGIAAPREFVDLILASLDVPLTDHLADLARSMTDILVTCATMVGEPRFHIAATCIFRALSVAPPHKQITSSTFRHAFPCAAEKSRECHLMQQCAHYASRASRPQAAMWISHIPSSIMEALKKHHHTPLSSVVAEGKAQ